MVRNGRCEREKIGVACGTPSRQRVWQREQTGARTRRRRLLFSFCVLHMQCIYVYIIIRTYGKRNEIGPKKLTGTKQRDAAWCVCHERGQTPRLRGHNVATFPVLFFASPTFSLLLQSIASLFHFLSFSHPCFPLSSLHFTLCSYELLNRFCSCWPFAGWQGGISRGTWTFLKEKIDYRVIFTEMWVRDIVSTNGSYAC